MRLYGDYQRDRVGWFFGLTGTQVGVLAAGAMPFFAAVHDAAWGTALASAGGWVLLLAVTVVPVNGRTAAGWLAASLTFTMGRRAGWTSWRSLAAAGQAPAPDEPDLPGVLHGLRVHEITLPVGERVAVLQHPARRTWTLTACLSVPGVGWADPDERDRRGAGLSALLDAACRTELVSDVLLLVRAVPDDGTARDHWLSTHRSAAAPGLARRVHDDLARHLTPAAVRHETFLTVVVPEHRLRRPAGASGGGLEGRGRVLAGLADELAEQVRGQLGTTSLGWLDSRGLAAACRAGFHPDFPVETSRADAAEPSGQLEVPWALAGPSHAEPTARSYRHDAWQSVSTTLLLPGRGAPLVALAPVLTGGRAGERRCLLVAFPLVVPSLADRHTATREWAADLGDGLRSRARVRPRAQTRADTAAARAVDAKLVRGAVLCRPYAVATTTVPADHAVADAARRLDASVRLAGFAAQRLDLAHDTAFAAGCLPLGHTLTPGART